MTTMTTTTWHYILTLGTYPDGADGPLRLYTFEGTMVALADAPRSAVYRKLRAAISAEHPAQADAVVLHSDIQPDTPQ
ncbi:hypothetical protein [Streptomyces sp. NPDC059783]|uniref:hypothetical protein n=1 Tax=Streptomyces sp. NPDC059783 TaxID=3346944 RepID=UPI00364A13B5